jgi:hypothetical protein
MSASTSVAFNPCQGLLRLYPPGALSPGNSHSCSAFCEPRRSVGVRGGPRRALSIAVAHGSWTRALRASPGGKDASFDARGAFDHQKALEVRRDALQPLADILICRRLSWGQSPLCSGAALIPSRPRRWRPLRGNRARSLGCRLDIHRATLKSGKGSSRCPTIQGLTGEIKMVREESAVDVAINWPYPAYALMYALAQRLLCVRAAAVTTLGKSCAPRWKFDQLPPAGLGLLAQHLDQHAGSPTANAPAPLLLPGFVAERLDLDGRAMHEDGIGQLAQGILTSGRIAPPELGQLCLGS